MWELGHKEGWTLKNWWFWTVVLEKTLESNFDCKKTKPANLKAMAKLWQNALKSRDITLPTKVHIIKAMAFPAVTYKHEWLLLFSTQPCLTLCDPMDCSRPGFAVLHHLPELVQTHVHWVRDTIQPSHPLSSPSPPAFSLTQYQGLF